MPHAHDEVYELQTEQVDDEQRAIYTHTETGLRVVCRQPEGCSWRVELWPPERMGDSALKRLGFNPDAEGAEARAKAWMADHPSGVPETFPAQNATARADGDHYQAQEVGV